MKVFAFKYYIVSIVLLGFSTNCAFTMKNTPNDLKDDESFVSTVSNSSAAKNQKINGMYGMDGHLIENKKAAFLGEEPFARGVSQLINEVTAGLEGIDSVGLPLNTMKNSSEKDILLFMVIIKELPNIASLKLFGPGFKPVCNAIDELMLKIKRLNEVGDSIVRGSFGRLGRAFIDDFLKIAKIYYRDALQKKPSLDGVECGLELKIFERYIKDFEVLVRQIDSMEFSKPLEQAGEISILDGREDSSLDGREDSSGNYELGLKAAKKSFIIKDDIDELLMSDDLEVAPVSLVKASSPKARIITVPRVFIAAAFVALIVIYILCSDFHPKFPIVTPIIPVGPAFNAQACAARAISLVDIQKCRTAIAQAPGIAGAIAQLAITEPYAARIAERDRAVKFFWIDLVNEIAKK